jgi:hypothetical protein
MKLTKERLQQIIKEEIETYNDDPDPPIGEWERVLDDLVSAVRDSAWETIGTKLKENGLEPEGFSDAYGSDLSFNYFDNATEAILMDVLKPYAHAIQTAKENQEDEDREREEWDKWDDEADPGTTLNTPTEDSHGRMKRIARGEEEDYTL